MSQIVGQLGRIDRLCRLCTALLHVDGCRSNRSASATDDNGSARGSNAFATRCRHSAATADDDSAATQSAATADNDGATFLTDGLSLFFAVMLLCQSCVISGYLTSLMMQNGMAAAAAQNGMNFPVQEMMQDLVEAVYDNMAIIMLIANLLTLFVICLIFRLRRRSPAREFALHFVNPLRLAEFALFGSAVNVVISVALSVLPLPERRWSRSKRCTAALTGRTSRSSSSRSSSSGPSSRRSSSAGSR